MHHDASCIHCIYTMHICIANMQICIACMLCIYALRICNAYTHCRPSNAYMQCIYALHICIAYMQSLPPTNQPTNQATNQTTNQPTKQASDQPSKQPSITAAHTDVQNRSMATMQKHARTRSTENRLATNAGCLTSTALGKGSLINGQPGT